MRAYPPLDTESLSQHTIKTPTPGIGHHNNSLTSQRDSENGEGERQRAMEVPDYEREARKYLEDLSKGVIGHEMDKITLEGLQVLQARAGFFRCKYLVPSRLSDQDGNWHVGAMTTLMDTLGAVAVGSCVEDVKATLELNISYYSKAKIQEEVEIEAKVVAQKEKMTSVVVEVRKRDKGELIALGKQWMATSTTNQSERSKL